MNTLFVNGELLFDMMKNGYRNLKLNMKTVDELNVFPIPDGDTGKNMTMTIEGGVLGKNDCSSVSVFMVDFSRNCLLSARGNSGVILSQFIKGLSNGTADKDVLTVADFIAAMEAGVAQAYKAVIKPVEGTMLTVLREATEAIKGKSFADFEQCLDFIIKEMEKSLRHTPELLAVLKEAGVVDSGGAGIVCIFEGIRKMLDNEVVDETAPALSNKDFSTPSGSMLLEDTGDMKFGYCTEFILQLFESKTDIKNFDLNELIAFLESVGDSIVAVREDVLVKVHVHTYTPEKVLAFAHKYGEFITLKIENMTLQHEEIINNTPKQKYAIVATATGQGIINYFKEIGVSQVVDGGQTNNPSASAFVEAFNKANAEHIVVLPNDGNILLTAKQAAEIYKDADVHVIETKSIAEGYSAISMMDLSVDTVEQLVADMTAPLKNVTTGYVTTSIRDANMNGIEIKKDRWLGLTKSTIYSCEDSPEKAAEKLLLSLPNLDEKQVITVFCGKGYDEAELNKIKKTVSDRVPLIEFGAIDGGQDIYRYIFCIE